MALSSAASCAARPHDPIKDYRLGHAFEVMAATLLDDKQPGDLALYSRRDHDRLRLGQRLCPRSDVRHIAENLAARIEHRRASVDGDPCSQCGFTRAFVLAVQRRQRALDREG